MKFKAVKLAAKKSTLDKGATKVTGVPIVGARDYKIIVLDDGSGVVEALHYPLTAPIHIGRRFRVGVNEFIIKEDHS
jgi:hypothetical protein